MEKDGYIEELYEKYQENFVRSEEYQNIAEKMAKKFDEISKKVTSEQLKDIEEFEQYLSSLLEIEVKEAFKNGFKMAKSLVSDNSKEEK